MPSGAACCSESEVEVDYSVGVNAKEQIVLVLRGSSSMIKQILMGQVSNQGLRYKFCKIFKHLD